MKPSVNGKVGAGAFAGALSVILVWGFSLFAGKDAVPPEIAAAFTTVLTFAVSWFVPDMIAEDAESPTVDRPSISQTISSVTRPAQAALN
jgi:H+/Cl- antiporter ClcA